MRVGVNNVKGLDIPIFIGIGRLVMTKGGGPHLFLFFDLCLHHGVEVQNVKGIEA